LRADSLIARKAELFTSMFSRFRRTLFQEQKPIHVCVSAAAESIPFQNISLDGVYRPKLEFASTREGCGTQEEKMGDLIQPWHIIVLSFVFCAILLVPAIFFLLTLQNTLSKCAPGYRTMEPGMVWLLLVPLFSLIWSFLVVIAVARSLANEYARRGIVSPEPLPGQPIGIAMCVCVCCTIIPLLGILAGLASLVLWIVYWVKIAEFSRMLDAPSVPVPMPPKY
jgi:hypothetical protein